MLRDRHLLYVIGQPGAGKSTLVAALTAGLEPVSVEERPFAHIVWGPDVVELGARREGFSGTDALSMSVQPLVVDWLNGEAPACVLAEGDRLANGKFFQAAVELGWRLQIVRLAVSQAVVERRRWERAQALGKTQNPAWLRGRVSKVAKLAAAWEPFVLDVDADGPPASVLARLQSAGNPVVERLRALVPSPS